MNTTELTFPKFVSREFAEGQERIYIMLKNLGSILRVVIKRGSQEKRTKMICIMVKDWGFILILVTKIGTRNKSKLRI